MVSPAEVPEAAKRWCSAYPLGKARLQLKWCNETPFGPVRVKPMPKAQDMFESVPHVQMRTELTNDSLNTLAEAVILQPYALTGGELRIIRKSIGLKGVQFADVLRISPNTLSNWENGRDPIGPQADLLARLFWIRIREEAGKPVHGANITKLVTATEPKPANFVIQMVGATVYLYGEKR